MALKDKIKLPPLKLRIPRPPLPKWSAIRPRLTPGVLWRLSLLGLAALAVLLLTVIWTSGTRDTRHAMLDGRRLIVHLDTGDIEGRQVSENKPPSLAKPLEDKTAATDMSSLPAARPPAVPKDTLMEKTADGPLPIIGPEGTKPWHYYAKPFDRTGSHPVIAIIVTGLGEGKTATEAALKLPETMTLSFSPYSRDASSWQTAARASGHEIMVDLPLQPGNYPIIDPGPYALLAGNGLDVNAKHLNWLMSRFSGYIGFVTPQNESFSADNESFKALLKSLSGRGLLMVMGGEPAKTDTRQFIEDSKAAIVTADMLIDEDLTPTAIQARLSSLEQAAKDRGYAIGIAQPYPLTMEQLAQWSTKLNADGVTLVPLSFIVKLRFS